MSRCFLAKRSTVTNLVEYLEKWTENFDKGIQVDIINYSKRVDTVVCSKIMYKLTNYGFVCCAYSWIEHFLTERKPCVKVSFVKVCRCCI